MKLVECVPNFSEGRRSEVITKISNAAKSVSGITVLDCQSDPSHNRMVLTFVGPPDAVLKAALLTSEIAIDLIDLNKHSGEHPRMGAVDVVPFVPLDDVTMEECIRLANEFGRELANKFSIPVFLYERAATRPERKNLADIRQGQFEELRELIGIDPKREPDYGPRRIHPTAGATAVGARPTLIAYNVNLNSQNLSIAKRIAGKIRERDGGLPSVRALGFELKDRGLVQVSMNLTDYAKTSLHTVFDEVSKLAKEDSVSVHNSEIVGLVPQDAITEASVHYLSLENFSKGQIIENRIFGLLAKKTETSLVSLSLKEFAGLVESKSPTPGGGSVAAYAGALAASLVGMVCNVTIDKKRYESVWSESREILSKSMELKSRLLIQVDRDATAYKAVSEAMKLPFVSEEQKAEREDKIRDALKVATNIPAETAELSYAVFLLSKRIVLIGNKNARSDAETALQLSRTSVMSAFNNVKANLEELSKKDESFVKSTYKKLDPILEEVSRFQD